MSSKRDASMIQLESLNLSDDFLARQDEAVQKEIMAAKAKQAVEEADLPSNTTLLPILDETVPQVQPTKKAGRNRKTGIDQAIEEKKAQLVQKKEQEEEAEQERLTKPAYAAMVKGKAIGNGVYDFFNRNVVQPLERLPQIGGIVTPLMVLIVMMFILIPYNGNNRLTWLWLAFIGKARVQGSQSTPTSSNTSSSSGISGAASSTNIGSDAHACAACCSQLNPMSDAGNMGTCLKQNCTFAGAVQGTQCSDLCQQIYGNDSNAASTCTDSCNFLICPFIPCGQGFGSSPDAVCAIQPSVGSGPSTSAYSNPAPIGGNPIVVGTSSNGTFTGGPGFYGDTLLSIGD